MPETMGYLHSMKISYEQPASSNLKRSSTQTETFFVKLGTPKPPLT